MSDSWADAANRKITKDEFIKKLANLVTEYRSQIFVGEIVGALEIVKLRLFSDTNNEIMKEQAKKKGQKNEEDPTE